MTWLLRKGALVIKFPERAGKRYFLRWGGDVMVKRFFPGFDFNLLLDLRSVFFPAYRDNGSTNSGSDRWFHGVNWVTVWFAPLLA